MAYAEVDVIVDGALDETAIFTDEAFLREFIDELEQAAAGDGYPYEVYVRYHEHSPDIECECEQYVTDHHPTYSWNVKE